MSLTGHVVVSLCSVMDWISEAESILAAQNALTQGGCDVVGASFVVATNTTVLQSLTSAQVTFCCLWSPAHGVKFNTSLLANDSSSCQQTETNNEQGSTQRSQIQHMNKDSFSVSDPSIQVSLSYCTAEYQVRLQYSVSLMYKNVLSIL